jgi:hypothetical protein
MKNSAYALQATPGADFVRRSPLLKIIAENEVIMYRKARLR